MNEKNEYFKCFRITLHIMKIFGIFPFIFSHPEYSKNLLLSKIITLFSMLLYLMMLTRELYFIMKMSNQIFYEFNFIIFIRVLLGLSTRILLISIPLVIWNKSQRLYSHWNKWQKLQEKFENIEQVPFLAPEKVEIRWMGIIGTMWVIITSPVHNYTGFTSDLSALFYLVVILQLILTYWYSNCSFVVIVLQKFQNMIHKAIVNERNETMQQLILLWLDFIEWRKDFNSIHSILFLVFVSSSTVNFALSLYSLCYILIFQDYQWSDFIHLTSAMFEVFIIIVFCENGNTFHYQMVTRVRENLLIGNSCKSNALILQEIEIFLQTIEVSKPELTLYDVMTLNRQTTISISSALINYIIVLKQFHQNEPRST